jgi:hypothetical protein
MSKKEKIQVELEVSEKSINVQHACCQNGHSLMDSSVKINGFPSIKVKVKANGQEGLLFIDPVYGSFNNIEKGISIPKGTVVELFCPECGESLTDEHETCQICSSPMFVFHLPKESIIEGCLKMGCMYHKLKIVDGEHQMMRLFENSTLESFL